MKGEQETQCTQETPKSHHGAPGVGSKVLSGTARLSSPSKGFLLVWEDGDDGFGSLTPESALTQGTQHREQGCFSMATELQQRQDLSILPGNKLTGETGFSVTALLRAATWSTGAATGVGGGTGVAGEPEGNKEIQNGLVSGVGRTHKTLSLMKQSGFSEVESESVSKFSSLQQK